MQTRFLGIALALCVCALTPARADSPAPAYAAAIVEPLVRPVMERYAVPGMAVGFVVNEQSYVLNYGVASKATAQPVGNDTLFEVGSVSKTFNATLAAYARVVGKLTPTDPVSKYLPDLRGSAFDRVTPVHLGTYTAGGLPLQVPDEVTNDVQLVAYFRRWQPASPPGTSRTYSNPSIGLLGRVSAASLDADYTALVEGRLLPALGLKNTFLNVPATATGRYAQGYTEDDEPTRVHPGVLDAETYGIRTTAADLLRFVEINLRLLPVDNAWQRAVADTHTGYYRIGPMTQDLAWEQYPYPVTREDLLAGNSDDVILKPNPAALLDPPSPPRDDVLINKTGSTNGFSAYVAFVPGRKVGVVMLANKRFPIAARVALVHEILTSLDAHPPRRPPPM